MKKTKKILIIVLTFILTISLTLGVIFYMNTKDTKLSKEKLILKDDLIEVLDFNNNLVKDISSFKTKEIFSINDLPEKVKFAFIDIEDRRFFQHNGFDFKGITRALIKNIFSLSFKEGASTISQQLIKNTHLTQEKTIQRKLKEIKLTFELEKKYSKDEILEKYLNTIYFGHNCFGLQSASQFYFNKKPSELTLPDGAILAGLIKSPNNYSPFKHPDKCIIRKKLVLSSMLKQKHITKEEYINALNTPLPILGNNHLLDKSYFNRVYEELEQISDNIHFNGSKKIKIYTYLDQDLQNELEKLTSLTSLDKTFSVLDNNLMGYKGYYSSVGNIKRLPGSLIKPLLVYAPAIEENLITPATPILDEKVDFNGYSPKNYNDNYLGYVSVRECIAKSLNIPAVKILNWNGIEKSVNYLNKMNLNIPKEDYSLALSLGGMKKGFTLNELVNAYSTFPNNGIYTKAGFIREIKINDKTIYKKYPLNNKEKNIDKIKENYKENYKENKVFSKDTAFLLNDMLKSVVENGTAKKLKSLNIPIAAKTGTNGTKNGNIDAYSIAYTTCYTVGVWNGLKDNSVMDVTGGGKPTDIMYKINEYLYKYSKPKDFIMPKNICKMELDKDEYINEHKIILADEIAPPTSKIIEIFKKDSMHFIKSTKYSEPHISMPDIEYKNNEIIIKLPQKAPKYYNYLIEKYDYVRHSILYSGKYIDKIIDKDIKKGKIYQYTITPVYKNIKGIPLKIPSIKIPILDSEYNIPTIPPDIIDKDWWNY